MIKKRNSGLTLVELLIAVALIGVLASLAAPSLSAFVTRNTVRSLGNEMYTGLQRARSEAVSRNSCVTICMSDSSTAAAPKCKTSGSDWSIGWIAYANPSCDTTPTISDPANANNVLFQHPAVAAPYSVMPQGSLRSITFNSRGNVSLNSTTRFTIKNLDAPTSEQQFGRSICVDVMGRARSIEESGNC